MLGQFDSKITLLEYRELIFRSPKYLLGPQSFILTPCVYIPVRYVPKG